MDIWQWVERVERQLREDGQGRLANLIDQLPGAVCDNEHARVDTIYPEALALARASGNPWLEVFVRHWNLQSRILHRHEVQDWMGEAVSLIEFANRDATRDCPQSICVTQDLVNCYGNADGPGYADVRIEASKETLSRIDPSWPCYRCIGGELIEALVDGGRADEALRTVDEMEAAVYTAHRWLGPHIMGESRVSILRALGRYEEALSILQTMLDDPEDEDARLGRQLEQGWLLALMGRFDASLAVRVPFESIRGTHSLYRPWAEVEVLLIGAGRIANDWRAEKQLRGIVDELRHNGVYRHAIEIALHRGHLAVARDRRAVAERCLAEARLIEPKLRAPLDAPSLCARLSEAISTCDVEPPASIESVDDALSRLSGDPEVDLDALDRAIATGHDDPRVQLQRAAALRALGDLSASEASVRALLDGGSSGSDDPAARRLLVEVLLERGELDAARGAAEGLVGASDDDASTRALLIELAERSGDRRALAALRRAEADADPTAPGPALALARLLDDDERPAEALEVLDRLCADGMPVGPWDDMRMLLGTRLGAWSAVRASATRRGFEVPPGAGPIEAAWELMAVRFADDERSPKLLARRTGPATATIVEFGDPQYPTHYDDEVIFDPRVVHEDDRGVDAYDCVEVVEDGGYWVFAIDGVQPAPPMLEGAFAALRAMGCSVTQVSGEAYTLDDPKTGVTYPAVYAYVAAPRDRLKAVELTLRMVCRDWAHPCIWPALKQRIGDDEGAAADRALADAWGM